MKRFQAVLKEVGMHPKARKVANAEDPRHREIKRAEEHFRSDEKITDFLNRVKFNVKKSKAVKTAKQPVPALKKLLVAPREVTTQNNNPEFLALFRFETVA
ncbi:hypothetical protein CRE_07566 [Caenorhabditis remanei]|uniref:Uncharacterized protein n=1 Tax=Caenorhabditis remanei TaxID=31234 RepID=E3MP93_CAERE|nr:hypothetical protein CRE_07566 [Caenorhabditis remanei]